MSIIVGWIIKIEKRNQTLIVPAVGGYHNLIKGLKKMIVDTFKRVHNYLRISLTDSCNLRCFYCMPEEEYLFTPTSKLMQRFEIETLAKTFVNAGVTKIRLTGGEPLVRYDAADIILALSQLPVELTMTNKWNKTA